MKIGLTLWVSSGPIAEPTTLLFYDRSERKLRVPRSARVRAEWQREGGFELQVVSGSLCRNDRWVGQIHGRHALTIGIEAVDRPLARRGKIELVVARRFARTEEGFETGVLPKTVGGFRSTFRSDADARHVGSERIEERDEPRALERQLHIQTLY